MPTWRCWPERGVEYLFANAGTDFAPIIEALAKAAAHNRRTPKAIVVPHENAAVAMAHGYYLVTGRPQAVMVHVNVGTANALGGLINAACVHVPVLMTAGRTPITEAGPPGHRDRNIHWAQEVFDQAAMLRDYVKWDYELRNADQLETVVDRALQIANSDPKGPVYLTLPREVLAEPKSGSALGRSRQPAPASVSAPDPETLAQVVDVLRDAALPLIITADIGADSAAFGPLAKFAERYAIPVVQHVPRYANLAADHPMHFGFGPQDLLQQADALVVLECDVPWIPALEAPHPDCRVIHIGVDPLYASYPVRGFRGDIFLTAAPRLALAQIGEALAEHDDAMAERIATRRARLASDRSRRDDATALAAREAEARPSLNRVSITRCLAELCGPEAIYVNEYPLALEHLPLSRPGAFFSASPSGGLGWGLGAALGIKLADPERVVVAALGDGAYMFNNPTACHFVAEAERIPVLAVVFNDRRWNAVRRSALSMYPDGYAARANRMPLSQLEPSPAFEAAVQASGGYGERVEAPQQLRPAIERALRAVTVDRRQALLNVICE